MSGARPIKKVIPDTARQVKSSVYAIRMRMKCSMGAEPIDKVGGNSIWKMEF